MSSLQPSDEPANARDFLEPSSQDPLEGFISAQLGDYLLDLEAKNIYIGNLLLLDPDLEAFEGLQEMRTYEEHIKRVFEDTSVAARILEASDQMTVANLNGLIQTFNRNIGIYRSGENLAEARDILQSIQDLFSLKKSE
jgi:hypothetical protein